MLGKIHRFAGPTVILLGLINGVVGLNFAGNNRAIIAYALVVLLMIIFVSTLLFLKKRRQMKKIATATPAADNFRQGQMELQQFQGQGGPPPPQYLPPQHMQAQRRF